MKKLILLFVLISNIAFSQKFILTPQNLVNAEDNSKSYIVLEFPEKTKEELYKSFKIYFQKLYDNSNFTMTNTENEQIVINNRDVYVGLGFSYYYYKDIYTFKDGKVKYEPYFEKLSKGTGFDEEFIFLQGSGGIYKLNGSLSKEKAKNAVESSVNLKLLILKIEINKQLNQADF